MQQLAGVSAADARTLVSVGALVATPPPWLEPVAAAVTTGGLSLNGAAAIQTALGMPDRVSEHDLAEAAVGLVEASSGVSLERLAALAREARTALDLEGVAEREEERRDRRFLSLRQLPDGMTRLTGLLDPESAAIVGGAIDAITSPRRGGPRFVDAAAGPQAIEPDARRTIPQHMVDALVDIVHLATKADTGAVFGKRRIALRVHVAERDLRSGKGYSHIEGQAAAVSVETAERIACDAGVLPISFDTDGQVVNVGREQRFHTTRQRIGLAARDGGCTTENGTSKKTAMQTTCCAVTGARARRCANGIRSRRGCRVN